MNVSAIIQGASAVIVAGLIVGCSGQSANGMQKVAVASTGNRQVVVQLVANDTPGGFQPIMAGLSLLAETVTLQQVNRAKAQYMIDGVPVVLVGASCDALRASHSIALANCEQEVVQRRSYGPAMPVGQTDSSGRANLELGEQSVRLRVESVSTLEDPTCSWGGNVLLPTNRSQVELPLLVYCE